MVPNTSPAKKICHVEVCEKKIHARGLCKRHYDRQNGGRPLEDPISNTGKPCPIEGCSRKITVRGMCGTHYERFRVHGSPHKVINIYRDDEARFWSKVEKSETCWNWQASKVHAGYGHLGIQGKTIQAHRYSYELQNGPIPEGMEIDHICHNPACVNPKHLRVVTPKQNQENKKGASSRSTTGVRGVYWVKSKKRYIGSVGHYGKYYKTRHFRTLEEAAEAVLELRIKLHTHNDLDRIK